MELQITGNNTEIKPDTHIYIERKFNKLKKHLPEILDIKIEISEEDTKSKDQRFLMRATVNSGVGRSLFHAEERAEDQFKATDKVAAILTRQLEKHKGKLYDRGRGNPLARGKFNQQETEKTTRKVVKTKRFVIEPMELEEAISQMEQLGHDFFLFYDADASDIRLLYRRKDGDYGLIEPEFK
ncbi:MAG: ribosomal subunit interface protein [Chloroflexi bacterium RBG_13_51_52]|nr:MAG: ribosomal subunit interface protein [Chloroflexi bacterium RBG_13_51_52]